MKFEAAQSRHYCQKSRCQSQCSTVAQATGLSEISENARDKINVITMYNKLLHLYLSEPTVRFTW